MAPRGWVTTKWGCSRGRPPRIMGRARRPKAFSKGSALLTADFSDGADEDAGWVALREVGTGTREERLNRSVGVQPRIDTDQHG